jgi:uncharacterized membrane protein
MGHSSKHTSRASKRAQFDTRRQSTAKPKFIIGAAVAILVVVISYMAITGGATVSAATRVSAASDGEVRIPVADVSSGQAKFFEYTAANSKPVRFFVIKSSDGEYRAAADACEVCFRDKKGYRQQGDDMVCNKCGRHFRSKDVNVITGSCNPDGIPRKIQGNTIVIAAADLEARSVLF